MISIEGIYVLSVLLFGFVAFTCGRLGAMPWNLRTRPTDKKIKENK